MRSLVVLALLTRAAAVAGQPDAALGKASPSAELSTGTIRVRVIAGASERPHTGARVRLDVDGIPRYATTGHDGAASFTNLRAGARVQAHVGDVDSEAFDVPASGGARVLLSSTPLTAVEPATAPPGAPPRLVPEPQAPGGTLTVQLVRPTLPSAAAPLPIANVTVSLVAYAADGTIRVQHLPTDARGRARFGDLDRTGATAYFAQALLPHDRVVDRLISTPLVLDDEPVGSAIVLAGAARDAKTAVDQLDALEKQGAVPAGTIRVNLAGVPGERQAFTIVDAATGKVVGRGDVAKPSTAADVAIRARPGQVLYVEATMGDRVYRSLPFQPLAHAGSTATVYIYPRVLATYRFIAELLDGAVYVSSQIDIGNYGWAPIVIDELPVPRRARNVRIADDDGAAVASSTGLRFRRPLAPGPRQILIDYEVPATAGRVAWSMAAPYGAFRSSVHVRKLPGVSLEVPNQTVTTVRQPDADYLGVDAFDVSPKQMMELTITLPKLSSVDAACFALHPDRGSTLLGQPAPAFTAAQLDGKQLRLSSLRGEVTVVTFMATWDLLSRDERPQLARLAELPNVVPLLVFSDDDASEVRAAVDAKARYRVVLDPPVADTNIGPATLAWGTKLLPESYVIDRRGVIRFYFSNARDWSSPAALACAKALARE